MAKIVKAKDKDNNLVYPITVGDAVVVDKDGNKTLQQVINGLGSASEFAVGTQIGNIPIISGDFLMSREDSTTAEENVPLVQTTYIDRGSGGKINGIAPDSRGALKSAAFSETSDFLPSSTNYAGSSSKGGAATSANKVNHTLTIGGKTFNGSSNVTITAEDLGLQRALNFVGVSTTNPTESGARVVTTSHATNPALDVTRPNTEYKVGDVVLYGNKEFVLTGTQTSSNQSIGINLKENWTELGDESMSYTKDQTDKAITDAINGLDKSEIKITLGTYPTGEKDSQGKDLFGTLVTSVFSVISQTDGIINVGTEELKIGTDQIVGKLEDSQIASAVVWSAKQDALTFTGTPSTTNKVVTADYFGFTGTYNKSTNKIVTQEAIASALFFDAKLSGNNGIDVSGDSAIIAAVMAAATAS